MSVSILYSLWLQHCIQVQLKNCNIAYMCVHYVHYIYNIYDWVITIFSRELYDLIARICLALEPRICQLCQQHTWRLQPMCFKNRLCVCVVVDHWWRGGGGRGGRGFRCLFTHTHTHTHTHHSKLGNSVSMLYMVWILLLLPSSSSSSSSSSSPQWETCCKCFAHTIWLVLFTSLPKRQNQSPIRVFLA